MWYVLWDPIRRRFAPLQPLTKIYVCAVVFVASIAALFAFNARIPFLSAGLAFVAVVIAAPVERYFLRIAARRQSERMPK